MVGDTDRGSSRVGPKRSRGRGLRTKTGCITCRKRHMKCDEQRPSCEKCTRAGKTCLYSRDTRGSTEVVDPLSHSPSRVDTGEQDAPTEEIAGPQQAREPETAGGSASVTLGEYVGAEAYVNHLLTRMPGPDTLNAQYANQFTSPASAGAASLDRPIGVATARWFDMLATDADVELGLNSGDGTAYTPQHVPDTNEQQDFDLQHVSDARLSADVTPSLSASSIVVNVSGIQSATPNDEVPWKAHTQLVLQQDEQIMFARFVTHISQWIDLFDPCMHFATLVPRLALQNTGLLKAILALSIRHSSLDSNVGEREASQTDQNALRYYHQTLNYVRTAMQYDSYHTSLELLATTLIISAFEMLHGSLQDWKRHLQGVFWIQRSQVIHGDSGGLRGAVWWAWLCQDVWAALRNKRRVFTFWKPQTPFSQLTPAQLASRSVFLLGKAVNYCVEEDNDDDISVVISSRLKAAESLSGMQNEWESLLTPEFMPLPYHKHSVYCDECKPIWIHPPMFACSVQIFHAARLLILLHQPSLGGFEEAIGKQRSLNKHVNAICGIALTLSDYASSTICSMCLFIAGLSTVDQRRRQLVLSLLEDNRKRAGWSTKPLDEELLSIWQDSNTT